MLTEQEQVNKSLINAAANGNTKGIAHALENGAQIECSNDSKVTPLLFAAMHGHIDAVQYLIQKGANIQACNYYQANALMLFIRNNKSENDFSMIPFLQENKINIDAVDDAGNTALHYAIKEGAQKAACKLIEYGANIDLPNTYQETPLLLLCDYSYRSVSSQLLHLLLIGHANVNASNKKKETPLLCAKNHKNLPLIDVLIANGANKNDLYKNGDNEFTLAAFCNNSKGIETLLSAGNVNVNYANNEGTTALMMAVANDNRELVERLLIAGANLEPKNQDEKTALLFSESYDMMKYLIDKGANINVVSKNNFTILNRISSRRGYQQFTFLLGLKDLNKSLLNLINDTGMTVLHKLVSEYNDCNDTEQQTKIEELIALVVSMGADPTINCNGETALQISRSKIRDLFPKPPIVSNQSIFTHRKEFHELTSIKKIELN